MDDELESLEAELKQLRPAAPSAELHGRIEEALQPRRRARVLWWISAVTLPIAAALALLLVWRGGSRERLAPEMARPHVATMPADAQKDLLKPVSAVNVLYAATDEGIVTLDDGTTARRERLMFVDTITWENRRTKASLTMRVPREEIRVVPIRYQ